MRDAVKNYFPLPNEIFCLDLCSGEIAVYAYLMYREDRKTFQCHPSYKTIGQALKMSRNTVSKYVKSLEAKHLITTEPTEIYTAKGEKHNGNLLYTILPVGQAVQWYFEQQLQLAEMNRAREKAKKKWQLYDQRIKQEAV
ncbi:MAG: helix-turn-helix domain-containing protein [Clostridia bacterium]|nr:helix-turn-helix domain-containing protein [Clostridia bacterium]